MTIQLTKSPIPLGDDENSIQKDPIMCYTCWNLYGGSAYTAAFSPLISMHSYSGTINATRAAKVKDIGTGPKWAGGPGARADYTSWGFDMKVADLPDSAAAGCQTCHLLQVAITELSRGNIDFEDHWLSLEVTVCKDNILLMTLVRGFPGNDDDDLGLFDTDVFAQDEPEEAGEQQRLAAWELYTLPEAPCPWPTIGNNVAIEFPRQDKNAAFGGSAQHVSPDATSDALFDRIRGWVKNCEQNHPICAQVDASTTRDLPRRVLDIGPASNDGIHLVEHDDEAQKTAKPYIALSHCWGKTRHLTTTTDTIQERKQNIPFEAMSRNFRDAITIARKLGIQYVWIDSMCIIQDDAEDWEAEAAKMTAVYNGAYLVVAAAATPNGDGGCLFDREPYVTIRGVSPNGDPFEIYGRETISHHVFHWGSETGFRARKWDPTNSHNRNEEHRVTYPLFSRAWCFQERMLATRMLHYIKDELVFECASSMNCECGALQEHDEDQHLQARQAILVGQSKQSDLDGDAAVAEQTPAQLQEDRHETWRDFMIEYSEKDITNQSDSLPAIAGLATKWQRNAFSGRYLAGIWEDDILRGMAWVAEAEDPGGELQYIAPSWSWLSVQRSVTWGGDTRSERKYFIKIDLERSACHPLYEISPFGQVSSGHLFITGEITPVRILEIHEGTIGTKLGKEGKDEVAENFLADSIFLLRQCHTEGRQVYCVRFSNFSITRPKMMGQDSALVLVRATAEDLERQPEQVRDSDNVFVRLGITDHYFTEDWEHEREAQKIDMYLI